MDLGFAIMGIGLAIGMIAIGAGVGISKIVSTAVEGIARQPDAEAKIFKSMMLGAALIEGVVLFCALITYIMQSSLITVIEKLPVK